MGREEKNEANQSGPARGSLNTKKELRANLPVSRFSRVSALLGQRFDDFLAWKVRESQMKLLDWGWKRMLASEGGEGVIISSNFKKLLMFCVGFCEEKRKVFFNELSLCLRLIDAQTGFIMFLEIVFLLN